MSSIGKCSFEKTDPPITTKESFHLSAKEDLFVAKLQKFGPLNSVLTNPTKKAECKKLGQVIFNHYKKEGGSNYAFGKAARIFTALAYNSNGLKTDEWTIFRNAVAKAWNGVGDSTGRWTA
jgi:hypothetical protein